MADKDAVAKPPRGGQALIFTQTHASRRAARDGSRGRRRECGGNGKVHRETGAKRSVGRDDADARNGAFDVDNVPRY